MESNYLLLCFLKGIRTKLLDRWNLADQLSVHLAIIYDWQGVTYKGELWKNYRYTERAANAKDCSEQMASVTQFNLPTDEIFAWIFDMSPQKLIERAVNTSANQPITWTHLLSFFFRNKLDQSHSVMFVSFGTPPVHVFDLIASLSGTGRLSWSRHPNRPTFFYRSRRSRRPGCLLQMLSSYFITTWWVKFTNFPDQRAGHSWFGQKSLFPNFSVWDLYRINCLRMTSRKID